MHMHTDRKRIGYATLFLALFAARVLAASDGIETIRKQYMDYVAQGSVDAGRVAKLLKTQKADGTWPDIDYTPTSGSKLRPHVKNAQFLAQAYRTPDDKYMGSLDVKDAVNRAVAYWLEKDYQADNWWHNKIAFPDALINTALLMGDGLRADLLQKIMTVVMPRSRISMTGQNKVWLASNVFVQSLIEGDEQLLRSARGAILGELRVTTKEGVQPDWSYHQHGPQQQFGNYGGMFLLYMIKWGTILRGEKFGFNEEELRILRNYLLDGYNWVHWKNRMDLSACGRQINKNCQTGKGGRLRGALEDMTRIDPENAALYQKRIDNCLDEQINTFIGSKHFWRSDMTVHRRPQWYASVKMSSRRVIGAETCNEENMLGLHQGDGVLLLYQTGDEYRNIQPFWDWKRLPGTTCDYTLTKLVPGRNQCTLDSDFVGGVSDGTTGIAVLDYYRRRRVKAYKSWFFEEDSIVCLGAGIRSLQGSRILTSVQQSLLQGQVVVSGKATTEGRYVIKEGDWVHHAGIGYHILAGKEPILKIATQKGDWKDIYPRTPSDPQSGKVFSLWIDHDKKASNDTYAYVIYPGSTAEDMPERLSAGMEILSNTPELQAIASQDGRKVRAVFYKPGILKYGRLELSADAPCLVSLTASNGKVKLCVSEPTQKRASLNLAINGKDIPVNLPQGGEAGKRVMLEL
jgi:chondroitin AC lyase